MATNEIRIRVITYNVAAQEPYENLTNLLGLKNGTELPDVFAIGFQEVSIRPDRVLGNALWEDSWNRELRILLKPYHYVKLVSQKILGIQLMIFVKLAKVSHFSEIEALSVRTGFKGLIGNKGAVFVSLECLGKSFLFVNCHLPAHDDQNDRRIQDYSDIVRGFKRNDGRRTLFAHDHIIWFGDLNFRLDASIAVERIRDALIDRTIMKFLDYDQLKTAQKAGKAFQDFQEGEIKFEPTFKFDIGKASYKWESRRPAWTDRILYRSLNDKLQLNLESYNSHEEYLQSDHKPVTAVFTVGGLQAYNPIFAVQFAFDCNWTENREELVFWISTQTSFIIESDDWIGLYTNEIEDLSKYVGYIWTGMSPKAVRSEQLGTDPVQNSSTIITNYPCNWYRRLFADHICIMPGFYRLVYMRNKFDVLGISHPFEISTCPQVM